MNKKEKIVYTKDDKEFVVECRTKRKIKKKVVLFLYVFFIMLLSLATIFIGKSIFTSSKENKITYTEKGNADYKVFLKDNDYYEEKYLGKNNRIIANLINTINIDFDYSISAKEKLNYVYGYEIIGELYVYDKDDLNKPLHKKTYNLGTVEPKKVNQTNIGINEDVVIDYDEYNRYFNSFKGSYGISSVGKLVVKMVVSTNVYDNDKNNQVIKNELSVSIPLSEQTIDISLMTNDINKVNTIDTKEVSKTTIFEMISLVLIVILLLTVIIKFIIFLMKLCNAKNDPYEKELKKILREYDSIIVNASSSFVEKKDKVIRVEDFKELLDAQKVHNVPILFYEVEKGNKSYFVLKDGETVYRFTLTKAHQIKKRNK